jgi:hypothetical protein
VGVTASNFRDREQLGLFTSPDEPRRHRVAEAADAIRERFGDRAVTRARLVRAALPTPFERDPMTAVERRGRAAVPEAPLPDAPPLDPDEVPEPIPDDDDGRDSLAVTDDAEASADA